MGNSIGLGALKVPVGNLQKNLQINIPVPAGSWSLKSHGDGGINFSCEIPPHLQETSRKLPYKVNFT